MHPVTRLRRLTASIPTRIGRQPTRTSYVPQIDGVRFLAIALVVVWHVSLRCSRLASSLNQKGEHVHDLYAWFPHGEVGVALFFFISGYVIAQPFLTRPRDQWQIGRFYAQRAKRIYPPYLIAITGCLAIVMTTDFTSRDLGVSVLQSWTASLFYLHGLLFDVPSRVDPPIWSLEVEIQFYLLSPIIIRAYTWQRHGNMRIVIGFVATGALILTASLVDFIRPFDGRFRFGLLAHLYLFIAGIVAADLARLQSSLIKHSSTGFDMLLLTGLSLLICIGLYLTLVDARPGGGWPKVLCDFGLVIAALAIVFGALAGHIGRKIMGAPWIALIGTMCFSIYLTHIVVIEAISWLLNRLPLYSAATIWGMGILVLTPSVLAVGLLYYVVVERPFMTLLLFKVPSNLISELGRDVAKS